MTYFHGTWQHDVPHDPIWMAYEVTVDGSVARRTEGYPGCRVEEAATDKGVASLVDSAFDPATFSLDDIMTLAEITS